MDSKSVPRIAITMGYSGGIGPELVIKVLAKSATRRLYKPVVIGDSRVLQEIAKICGLGVKWNKIERIDQAKFDIHRVDLIDIRNTPIKDFEWGKVIPSLGRASGEYLEIAWEMAMKGEIDGIISCPLQKNALHEGGYSYRDELEFFTCITKSQNTFIVGIADNLWTISVTGHIPFKEISKKITKGNVFRHVNVMDQIMRRYGVKKPRIAVAALNVHGGEGGLFGDEDMKEIEPAVLEARKLGINVFGPCPADTIFMRALNGEFNSIVGMYHDQVNIGRKLIGKIKGATVMLGLPVPCGTTDHGTALDKAGKCVADTSSMNFVLKVISRLSHNK